jgi:hypothetical protein
MTNTVSPLDVTPFIARITAQCPAIRFVGRAADNVDVIENGPKVTPSAYVLEPSYKSTGTRPNASGGALVQMIDCDIKVLVCCQNYAGATGGAAAGDAYTARKQVFLSLLGWQPFVDGFAVEAGSGQLAKYTNNIFYYLDSYHLRVQLRNIP